MEEHSSDVARYFSEAHTNGWEMFSIAEIFEEATFKGHFTGKDKLATLRRLVENTSAAERDKKRTYLQLQFSFFCKNYPPKTRETAIADMAIAGTADGARKYPGWAIMEITRDGSPRFGSDKQPLLKDQQIRKDIASSRTNLFDAVQEKFHAEQAGTDAQLKEDNSVFHSRFQALKK